MGIKQRELKKLGVLSGSKNRKLIGFGLTIANYIASVLSPPEKRGIFVRSRLGRGSVFSFYVNHLEQTKLKPSNISKSSRGSEIFDQINLSELVNLQISSRSSNKGVNSMVDYLKDDEPKEEENSGFDKGSQLECLRREDQESPGALEKNISLLARLNTNTKFFQRLNDPNDDDDDVLSEMSKEDQREASQIKCASEEKSSNSSSAEEIVFQDLKYFRKLFPVPSSVDLLINRTLKYSSNEEERSNGSSKEKLKISGQLHALNNPLEKFERSPKSPVPSEIYSRKINMTNSDEDNIITAEKGLKSKSAEKKRTMLAENPSERIASFPQRENKLENMKDLISQIKKKKTCNCPELLLVDDNGYNLMVLRLIIESFGLKADTAKSGDEAVSLVKKRISGAACSICRLYYVVLMDIDMPEKDGLETTTEIFELIDEPSLEPVVIACTAFHESEFGQRCSAVGMKDFITKPIKKPLLETVLLKHFERFFL